MQFTVRLAIDVAEGARRQPTVLVMSEDQDWCAALRRVLEQEGYAVLTARHAGHALVTSMRHPGRVDLLVSDGGQGRRRSDLPLGIFRDNPGLRLLHLDQRPGTREQLLEAISRATR